MPGPTYRWDDTTDAEAGLTTYGTSTAPTTPTYTTPDQAAAAGYDPNNPTSYMPAANVTVAAPTAAYGQVPVAGETLYASMSEVDFQMRGRPSDPRTRYMGKPTQTSQLNLGTIDEVAQQILTMEESDLREIQKKLGVKATGFADPNTIGTVGDFLNYVSQANALGTQETWKGLLNKVAEGKGTFLDAVNGEGAYGGPEAQPFSGTKTQTSTSSQTQLLSRSQTRNMAEQAFVAAIGRAPTRKERQALRAKLNEMSRENPQTTTSTRTATYEDGDLVDTDTDSVTEGGVDFGQKVLNEARSQEGYAEYQAATTYFDAMMSALSAPGSA